MTPEERAIQLTPVYGIIPPLIEFRGMIADAIRAAAGDEREACAKLCESDRLAPALYCPPWDDARRTCAKAIRGEWPFDLRDSP